MSFSINKHIQLVQFFYIGLDISQFFLIPLFPSLRPGGIHKSHVGHLLVGAIDLIPFPLESFPDLPDFFLRQALSEWRINYLSSLFCWCKFWIMVYSF
jgi:hypothetical protein